MNPHHRDRFQRKTSSTVSNSIRQSKRNLLVPPTTAAPEPEAILSSSTEPLLTLYKFSSLPTPPSSSRPIFSPTTTSRSSAVFKAQHIPSVLSTVNFELRIIFHPRSLNHHINSNPSLNFASSPDIIHYQSVIITYRVRISTHTASFSQRPTLNSVFLSTSYL